MSISLDTHLYRSGPPLHLPHLLHLALFKAPSTVLRILKRARCRRCSRCRSVLLSHWIISICPPTGGQDKHSTYAYGPPIIWKLCFKNVKFIIRKLFKSWFSCCSLSVVSHCYNNYFLSFGKLILQ